MMSTPCLACSSVYNTDTAPGFRHKSPSGLVAWRTTEAMGEHNPKQFFLILAAVLICGVSGLIFYTLKLSIIHVYLIGINLVTFIAFGFDKRQAIKTKSRVPEVILYLLALIGGTPAGAVAQIVFHHKTKKRRFQTVFITIIFLQAAAVFTAIYLACKAA